MDADLDGSTDLKTNSLRPTFYQFVFQVRIDGIWIACLKAGVLEFVLIRYEKQPSTSERPAVFRRILTLGAILFGTWLAGFFLMTVRVAPEFETSDIMWPVE